MPAPETRAGKRTGYDGASVLQMQRRVFTGRDADRSGSSGLSVRERGVKRRSTRVADHPPRAIREPRRGSIAGRLLSARKPAWPEVVGRGAFRMLNPLLSFTATKLSSQGALSGARRQAGPSPSAGLFRSLLPVVKPDKAARQTLPNLGKPHPSGPARQDTG